MHYLGFTALFAPSATGVGDIIAVYEPHLRPGQLTIVESVAIPAAPAGLSPAAHGPRPAAPPLKGWSADRVLGAC